MKLTDAETCQFFTSARSLRSHLGRAIDPLFLETSRIVGRLTQHMDSAPPSPLYRHQLGRRP